MKYLIMIMACCFFIACGDKEEDTGADTANAADTSDAGDAGDAGEASDTGDAAE